MRQERDMVIPQSESLSRTTSPIVVTDFDDFTFAEMVATTIRPQLFGLAIETQQAIFGTQPLDARAQRIAGFVMPDMSMVFTAQRPVLGNTEFLANRFRCSFDQNLLTKRPRNVTSLRNMTAATARSRRRSFADRVDQCATNLTIGNRTGG